MLHLNIEFLQALETLASKKNFDRAICAAIAARDFENGESANAADLLSDLNSYAETIFQILTQNESGDLEEDMEDLDLFLGELELTLIKFILNNHKNINEALKSALA